jgi:signal peptidase
MKGLRIAGDTLLWVLALLGVLSGALWAANAAGWVQPLVVVSGSMEPEIEKGDLLLATPIDADRLAVGQVVSLHSDVTGKLVTHRVISVVPDGSRFVVELEGDANRTPDPEPYLVPRDATVWHPVLIVPAVGDLATAIARPAVAIPLAVAVLALIAASLVPATPTPRRAHLAPKRRSTA